MRPTGGVTVTPPVTLPWPPRSAPRQEPLPVPPASPTPAGVGVFDPRPPPGICAAASVPAHLPSRRFSTARPTGFRFGATGTAMAPRPSASTIPAPLPGISKTAIAPVPPDLVIQYGEPGWVPVVGDWSGDGKDTIGVFDPSTATWYLCNYNARARPTSPPSNIGGPNWTPVVGDWNGDGKDSIGVFDPSTATWYLRNTPTQVRRTTARSSTAHPVGRRWSATGAARATRPSASSVPRATGICATT